MPLNTLPILSLLVITLASCLPIDEDIPQCFPNESCPLGTVCMAGECKAPAKHLIGIDASCLDQQCQENLTNYTSDESAADIDTFDISQKCLILIQKNQIQTLVIEDIKAEISANLFEENTQAFLLFVDRTQSCPQFDTYPEENLANLCLSDQGCHMYLRANNLQVTYGQQQIFNFTYEDGQCLASQWVSRSPEEVCDQGDNDCDGFIDEGVNCND